MGCDCIVFCVCFENVCVCVFVRECVCVRPSSDEVIDSPEDCLLAIQTAALSQQSSD